jgi:O-antigen ligase
MNTLTRINFYNVLKNNTIKTIKQLLSYDKNILIFSVLLSATAILLDQWSVIIVPISLIIILSFIYGERLVIAVLLIALFTLVGELDKSLRLVVQLVSLGLLTILFLKRFGLEFYKYRGVPKAILYFLILYFSAMIIASVASDFPSAGIPIIVRQFLFFIVAYMFYSLIDHVDDIKNYLTSIIIVAIILVTISNIYFIIEGYDLLDLLSITRVRVTILISNPEALTNFYVISVPFIIINLLLNKSKFSRIINLSLLIYISLGLILTMSRSAILGIAFSTAIILFLLRLKVFLVFAISIVFIVLVFVFYEPLNELIYLVFRFEEGMSERDYLWAMSVDMIKDHPVFGIGPGANNYVMMNYFPYMLDNYFGKTLIYFAEVSEGVNLSHNIFLAFFTEMGILGFVAIVALPIVYFKIAFKTIEKYKYGPIEKYYIIVALFAAGTSVIVRNFFNSIGLLYIGGIVSDLPFWLIFGSLIYFYKTPLPATEVHETKSKSLIP